MSNLFLALFFVAIIALIVGLISPKLVVRWGAEEKRTRGRVALIYGVAIVVLFVAFGVASDHEPHQSVTSPSQTTTAKPSPPILKPATPPVPAPVAVKPVAATPAPTAAPVQQVAATPVLGPSWDQVEINQDTVTNQLHVFVGTNSLLKDTGFPADLTKVSVFDRPDLGGKQVVVEYKPGETLNDTTFVEEAAGSDLDVMKLLFQNKQIVLVNMDAMADMTDQYGNTTTEIGVSLSYNRSVINEIDWSGFEERVCCGSGRRFQCFNCLCYQSGHFQGSEYHRP